MVTEVYSEVIDEDRRYNAQKLDEVFYSSLNKAEEPVTNPLNEDELLLQLLKTMSPEIKKQLLQQSIGV